MRLQLITQLFDPENAIKGLSFVKELASQGYDVEVVTTYPSYPGGKIYPGYKMRLIQIEEIDGIRIVRVPSYIAHGRSAIKRMLSYSSFSISAFLYSIFIGKRPDIIYSYYPPMIGGIFSAMQGAIQGRPFIYDVQDLWPEALTATGMLRNQRIVRYIDLILGWVYKRASAIVVLSDGYKDALITKGVPAEKIHRIYNWCDESRINNHEIEGPEKKEHFDIAYAGNLGTAQALDYVIDAAHLVQSQNSAIKFTFIGDGIERERLQNKVKSMNLRNVFFKGRVAPEVIGTELQKADALLVHLADDPVFRITIPSKTQAYLSMGKPILMAVSGESADIINRAGAGIVSKPCSPRDIAAAALEICQSSPAQLDSFGKSAEIFYAKHMSQKNGVNKISLLLKRAAKSNMHDIETASVRRATHTDIPEIIKIHQQAFPGFLMTLLGPSFLYAYYKTVLDHGDHIFLVATDNRSKVLGFVAGFATPAKFYQLLGSRKRKMMLSAAAYVALRPHLWMRILENMSMVRQRSSVPGGAADGSIELASIGVDPTGGRRGYGKTLVNSFIEQAQHSSAAVIDLTTDALNNEPVNNFYTNLGFLLTKTSERAGGRKMNHYRYEIKK